jgi:hypothetical protein
MEVAPPLHSSWEEDDELPADEELDTACPPCVVATHHRRDASADASPPRSPSRKEGTPDATQVHRPVPAKQQQRAARVALEAATQLAEAAARLAQSPLGMATGGTCAASAYAPGAFTSLLSALPALVIFLTLMALIAALFGTAPPSRRRPRSTSAPPCIAAAASAAHRGTVELPSHLPVRTSIDPPRSQYARTGTNPPLPAICTTPPTVRTGTEHDPYLALSLLFGRTRNRRPAPAGTSRGALARFLGVIALTLLPRGSEAMPPRGTPKAYSLFVPPGCSRHGAPVPAGVGVYNSYTLAVADGASGVQGGAMCMHAHARTHLNEQLHPCDP